MRSFLRMLTMGLLVTVVVAAAGTPAEAARVYVGDGTTGCGVEVLHAEGGKFNTLGGGCQVQPGLGFWSGTLYQDPNGCWVVIVGASPGGNFGLRC